MRKVVLALLLVICISSPLYAAQSTIVDVEGNACMGDDKSRKQTEQAAMADAKRSAAERALTYLKSETEVKNMTVEKDLVNVYAQATVKIIQELEKNWFRDANSGDCYRIKIKAEIVPDEKALEKAFKVKDFADNPGAPLKVQLWTDKGEYKRGEKIKIYVKGNKPFHARILYKDTSGQIVQILPNPYRKDNYFQGGVVYELPEGNKDRFRLEVSPPFGSEQVILFASTAPLGDLDLESGGEVYGVKTKERDIGIISRGIKIIAGDRLGGVSASRPPGAEFVESNAELKTLR